MSSPQSGFRRAAVASWALAGIGVAGVAGASALAYADTVKPAVETPAAVESVDVPAADPAPASTPPPPAVTPRPEAPAPVPSAQPQSTPEPAYTKAYTPPPAPAYAAPAPAYTAPPAPVYTAPAPAYTPPVVAQQAPAPAPQTSSSGGFPIRQSHVSVGSSRSSSGNKFSPPHTSSRGS